MSKESQSKSKGHPVVVVGAGQIGVPVVQRLAAAGHRVIWVSRASSPNVPEGVVHVNLDARDGDALAQICVGAAAVIAVAGPASYDAEAWARTLPPLWRGLLRAAEVSGARLVLLDNLYIYEDVEEPLSPNSPQRPATRKGLVRKQVADMVVAAQRRGGVRVVTLRASDFWGPGLTNALYGETTLRRLKTGRPPVLVGDPDAMHAFSHRDDVVDALITLALTDADVEGQVFHAPVMHATPRELINALGHALGVATEVRPVPRWMLHCAGLFSCTTHGLIEMLPFWEKPYLVDDASYTQRFRKPATSLVTGAAQLATQA